MAAAQPPVRLKLAETPPANFYSAVREPGKAASTISQVFLGVRIECAQCHHHPFDRWSQEDYFGMTAYFAQLQRKNTPLGEILLAEGDPATTHPRTGQAIPAHALAQPTPEKNPAGDRRRELVELCGRLVIARSGQEIVDLRE